MGSTLNLKRVFVPLCSMASTRADDSYHVLILKCPIGLQYHAIYVKFVIQFCLTKVVLGDLECGQMH